MLCIRLLSLELAICLRSFLSTGRCFCESSSSSSSSGGAEELCVEGGSEFLEIHTILPCVAVGDLACDFRDGERRLWIEYHTSSGSRSRVRS